MDPIVREFTMAELWAQLQTFSSTLLREELSESRRHLTQDIGEELSRILQNHRGMESPLATVTTQSEDDHTVAASTPAGPRPALRPSKSFASSIDGCDWINRTVRAHVTEDVYHDMRQDPEDEDSIPHPHAVARASTKSGQTNHSRHTAAKVHDAIAADETFQPKRSFDQTFQPKRSLRGEEDSSGHSEDDATIESKTPTPVSKRSMIWAQRAPKKRLINRLSSSMTETPHSRRSHTQNFPEWRYTIYRVVKMPAFEFAVALLVVTNAVSIGVQTDTMVKESLAVPPASFQIIEGAFCVIFSLELCLRMFAFGHRFFSMFGWRWNVFDLVVVILQVLETITNIIIINVSGDNVSGYAFDFSVLRVFRVVRLVRIIRVIRAMRSVEDLRTLVHSIFGTFRPFCWILVMMLLLIYISAVQFTQIVSDYKIGLDKNNPEDIHKIAELDEYFGSLSRAILSLFAAVSGGVDWQTVLDPLIDHISPFLAIVFCAYISFAVFALLNVVTGIFVQSAMVAARQSNESYVVTHVRELFRDADLDGSGILTLMEFQDQLNTKPMKEYFKHLDIDISEAHSLFNLLDSDGDGGVSLDEFVNGSLRLRGEARALEMEVLKRILAELIKKQEGVPDMISKINHQVAQMRRLHSAGSRAESKATAGAEPSPEQLDAQ